MLPGLDTREMGRLQMSVGYNTHKKGRPLSPVEVGELLKRAQDSGASPPDCAKALNLEGTSQVSRFVRILGLPPDVRHLVGWGRSRDSIGFTTAVELVRIDDPDDQRAVAKAILEEGLQTSEVRQVAQIRRRSGRSIETCLKEVIGMRPTVDRRYVFIGAVSDRPVQAALGEQTQAERDALLQSVLGELDIRGASGRLGTELFTLVGDEGLNASIKRIGKSAIEARVAARLAERTKGAARKS